MSIVSSYRGTGNHKGTNPGRGYAGVQANRAGRLLAVMLLLVFAGGSHAVEPVYSFEIPRQTADGALTALGEQASRPLAKTWMSLLTQSPSASHGFLRTQAIWCVMPSQSTWI